MLPLTNTPKGFQNPRFPLTRLYGVASTLYRKISPKELNDQEVLHYSIPNVQEHGTGIVEDGTEIDSDKWILRRQSVLISKLNPRKSTICLADPSTTMPTVASTEFVPLETSSRVDNRFLSYVLQTRTVTNHLTARTESATRSHQRVTPRLITSLGVPWPSSSSRTQIVDYLDRETAEIDAFIADLENLKTITTERTTAFLEHNLWSQAHEFASLRRFLLHVDQGASPEADSAPAGPGETGVLKAGCTNNGRFNVWASKRLENTDQFAKSMFVSEGDLIVTRASGSLKHVGSAALVPCLDRRLAMSDKHYRLTTTPSLDREYLALVMQTNRWRDQLEPLVSGAQGLARNISVASLKTLQIPVVSRAEQGEIKKQLKTHVDEAEIASNDIDSLISLAQERRQALISAAVTGQIDVSDQEKSAVEQLQDELKVRA